jgi:hypothetical protein
MSSAKSTDDLGREPKKESNSDLHRGVEGAVKAFERRLSITERYGVTVAIAAEYVGISKSSIYELLASGDLAGRIIAGRMIVEMQGPQGLLHLCGQAPSAKRENKTTRPEESASP